MTIRKQGCQSYKKTVEDENDILVKNIYTGLLLFLGVLSTIVSAVLVVYSAVLVIYRQQFLMEFLKTLIFAAPLLVLGLGSLYYIFGKWKTGRARKKSFALGLELPQRILCEKCGAVLYEGMESISPYEIIKGYGGRCPRCGEELSSVPTDFEVKEIAVRA